MLNERIGQARIAEEAGVHITTVSLALRDSPRLPQSTRDRIRAIAQRLGYQPDPMLSALTAYRRNSRLRTSQGTLAWVTGEPSAHLGYYEGAAARCHELGYQLDTFDLGGVPTTRLSKILLTRSINGLLLAPQRRSRAHLNLDWKHFSAVTFGHTLVRPRLHRVTNAQYHTARICTRALRARGYRRIGFVTTRVTDERTDQNFSAGFQVEQRRFKEFEKLPMLVLSDYDADEQRDDFRAWYERHAPEAIVTHYRRLTEFMRDLGISYARCALASVDRPADEKGLAGIDQNYPVIGRMAVDLVVGMMYRNERGIPQHAANLVVEGTWRDGDSAPRRVSLPSAATH